MCLHITFSNYLVIPWPLLKSMDQDYVGMLITCRLKAGYHERGVFLGLAGYYPEKLVYVLVKKEKNLCGSFNNFFKEC